MEAVHSDGHEEDRLLVLIVEDHSTTRTILRALLEIAGYRVVTAPDGRAGLRSVEDEHPAVILTDLVMPGLDGVQLARRVRAGSHADTPIIAATANRSVYEPEELDTLFQAVLEKPIRPDSLVQTVRSVVGAT